MNNLDITTYRLVHSSPDNVFEWLKNNSDDKNKNVYDDYEIIENELLKRNDPLINLGLALYGQSNKVGHQLYQTGDKTIKKAVLSGISIFSDYETWLIETDILRTLLNSFDKDLLKALFANQNIDEDLLVNLYEKTDLFSDLNDEQWNALLWASIHNKRISTNHNDDFCDGYSEYCYEKVFTSAWKLFESLPANPKNAALLSRLSGKLVKVKPHDMDIKNTIVKWKIEGLESEECRQTLADFIEVFSEDFKNLKNSGDPALRKSYYRRFSPEKPEEIRQCYNKDKDVFLFDALENQNLYKEEKIRHELDQCCWDYTRSNSNKYDLIIINIYKDRSDMHRKNNPKWFIDNDFLNDIEDPILRIESKLNTLISTDEQEEEEAEKINARDSVINATFENVAYLTTTLNKHINKKPLGWPWFILGVVAGYLLNKI